MCAIFNRLHHASAVTYHIFKASRLFIHKIQQVNNLTSCGAVYAGINSYFRKSRIGGVIGRAEVNNRILLSTEKRGIGNECNYPGNRTGDGATSLKT